MGYEHFVAAAARVVELAGVAVLLVGALLAGGAFTRRLRRGGAFPAAYDALRPTSAGRSCSRSSCS